MDARKSHAVAPQLVFGGVGVRVFQPLHELGIRLRFGGGTRHGAVGLKNIPPEGNILFGRLFRAESGTPPVREALESRTLRWRQPADDVVRFFRHGRRILVIRSHKRVDDVLFRLCVIGALACGVGRMRHSAGASGHHRRFDLGFDARGELRVLSLVVGCAVESVGNAVLFRNRWKINALNIIE